MEILKFYGDRYDVLIYILSVRGISIVVECGMCFVVYLVGFKIIVSLD